MQLPDQLSDREKTVTELLLQGKSNKQIALNLGVSNRTIEFHLSNIYAKLGVSSRSEAILFLTRNSPAASDPPAAGNVRESTVADPPEMGDHGEKPRSQRRARMLNKKLVYALSGALVCALAILYLTFPKIREGGSQTPAASPTPKTAAVPGAFPPSQIAPGDPQDTRTQTVVSTPTLSLPTPPAGQENVFTQAVGSTEARLFLNWFYIDASRLHLDLTLCDFPIPAGFDPIYLIDAEKITVYKTDGSPVEVSQQTSFGGGGGGENPPQEKIPCYNQVFDYTLEPPQPVVSQGETYILDIPAGGTVTGATGEIRSIPSAAFHVEVRPTYSGRLTFANQKTAAIEDKTVTLKSVEINPSGAGVVLCVFDPGGEQWLPGVQLLYKGDIINASSSGLTGSPVGETRREMCYRLNYPYSFHLDAASDPQTELSVLVSKLTKDQPERLPYPLIARAQNELALEGIEFNYVIVSHGAGIVITKKPAGFSEAQALKRVNDALTQDALPSGVLVFRLD